MLAALIAALLIAAAVFAATLPVHLSHGVGDQTYVISDASSLKESYTLGIGDLTLDLSGLQLPVGETHLETRVDIGRTTVIVPPDAAVQGIGEAEFGEIRMLGNETDGRDSDRQSTRPVPACSCSTAVSARARWSSSAPYDEAGCRSPSQPRPEEGVIAGVCAGIAQALAVDATLVRLVFAILALAGGAGIFLYLALWAYDRYEAGLAGRLCPPSRRARRCSTRSGCRRGR